MSSANATGGGVTLRPRPTTRSSIRHSLNLSSVGRAIADAMHKDTKDTTGEKEKEKTAKKTKEVASRRSSAINIGPPSSLRGIDRAAKKDKDATLESKTVSRGTKRLSVVKAGATSSDEPTSSPAASPKVVSTRASTLRPRNSTANSGLPKYRPKSIVAEPAKKPPSPARPAVRRKASTSDDETDQDSRGKGVLGDNTSKRTLTRAISPLPRRGAFKVNLSAAINVTPTTDKKGKPSTPRGSPVLQNGTTGRASKAPKTSTISAIRSAIPRPPSSASSNSSRTPRTPHSADTVVRSPGSSPARSSRGGSPLRNAVASPSGSPTRKLTTRRTMRGDSSGPSTPTPMLTEDDSTDSLEAQDIEFMLSSVASPSAPTPALPRLRNSTERSHDSLTTPSRSFLPSRAHLSRLSPVLASNENSPFLLPPPAHERGSILSWESLATHSKTLGEDEFGNLLSDVPAPFRPGAISPSPNLTSMLNLPDSPNLSALPSPAEYGSISQVLLPDVTPSPAVYATAQLFEPDPSAADAAAVTLLRLQLAAAESRAREQALQVESLQSELLTAKQARLRDAEELSKQISQLEDQVVGNLRVDDQRSEYIGSLEDQLRHAHAHVEQAAEEARAQAQHATLLREQQNKWQLACAAHEARSAWSNVRDTVEGELEFVRANRETLAVLLAGLDHSQRLLTCQTTC
ncbi:hypothetical protein CERSUDRAFT_110125 [Gelatoporia subvermispora B]|uniref:Uncharacterized protein n=1 Tax=Ceriporiopsis subvermispora (strain B) TaxID=914234 RepID=M2RAW9_CERS8|nr:hypothetical protein CERSUDRAFT_110125 [Gelatoporia subvermispora B]